MSKPQRSGILQEGTAELRKLIRESTQHWYVRVSMAFTVFFVFFYAWTRAFDVLATKGFEAHGYCLLWKRELIVLYVGSDFTIWLSYISISAMLVFMVFTVYRTRRTIPFQWIFVAFGAFIILCGFTHFMDMLTLWI